MAWTDACKIEAVAQIDHKVKHGLSVRKALTELAGESGIPAGTIRRWKYPESTVPKNGNTPTEDKIEISQKRAWWHVEKTLEKLVKYMMENCHIPPDEMDRDILRYLNSGLERVTCSIERLNDELNMTEEERNKREKKLQRAVKGRIKERHKNGK